jgi:hypothetical protein
MQIARQAGRILCDVMSCEDLLNIGPECQLVLDNVLRPHKEFKDDPQLERRRQFLEILRATDPFETSNVIVPLVVSKPTIKTYSRKKKQIPMFKPRPPPP